MNYELLFNELHDRRIRIALTGANGGFGRTFIAQCRVAPQVELSVLCDRDVQGLHATLLQMGFAPEALRVCASEAEVGAAGGRVALVADADWLAQAPHDIVIEATGAPETSVAIAEAALRRRVHVGMVTKETDSVVGPWLNRLALEHGVVYTTVDGDQPAALIGLVTWARVLGFEVVCAGKASEHDFIHDPRRGVVTHAGVSRVVPGLENLWTLGTDVASTLEARRRAMHAFPLSATPDYCEMNVVSNSTGLLPSCDALNYPLCRASELADVFVPVEDGGILRRTGVVDVFNPLRRSGRGELRRRRLRHRALHRPRRVATAAGEGARGRPQRQVRVHLPAFPPDGPGEPDLGVLRRAARPLVGQRVAAAACGDGRPRHARSARRAKC